MKKKEKKINHRVILCIHVAQINDLASGGGERGKQEEKKKKRSCVYSVDEMKAREVANGADRALLALAS